MTKSTSPKTPNNSELEKKIAAVCGLLLPKEIDQILALLHTETQRAVEEYVKWQYGERCETKDTDDFPDMKDNPKHNRCPTCEAYDRLDEYEATINHKEKP